MGQARFNLLEVPAIEKAKDLIQKAGQWLSSRFGTGGGADFERMAKAYDKIAEWASGAATGAGGAAGITSLATALSLPAGSRDLEGLLRVIRGPGYKSATRNHLKAIVGKSQIPGEDLARLKELAGEDAAACRAKVGRKGRRPWADRILQDVEAACGFTYLQNDGPARHQKFAVMLDHAARRVSIGHSWIKRAERRRREFEEDAKKLTPLRERAPVAVDWLERFCEERSARTGASTDGGYRIRKRALGGKYAKAWKAVATEWARNPNLREDERIEAIHHIQSNWDEDEKFGDEQLFKAIAEARMSQSPLGLEGELPAPPYPTFLTS